MNNVNIFRHRDYFTLQSAVLLPEYHLAYTTHGTLNERGDNVVWVFHALTANSDPFTWWPGLAGPGKLLDPAKYFIVCVNMPGSCYGSIGPLENKPGSNQPFYHTFPLFTTRDMIRAYQPLRVALGITKIHIGIGGSMGGQQLLEWAIEEPDLFEYIIPIATNAWHSAWGKAFNASQRWCIELDKTWQMDSPLAGIDGMQAARSMALLSYRHYKTYDSFQSDEGSDAIDNFKAASYQRYQGEKLAKRFNAFSYHSLSRSMDSHHVGRERGGAADALKRIKAAALVIGVRSDILFPLQEQEYLAQYIPYARLTVIDSLYGHDGFLLEYDAIAKEVGSLLATHSILYNE